MTDRQSPFLGIHAVNVFVRDQDQSLRFYVDVLGFDLAFDVRLESGERWLGVAPPDGSTVLLLIAPQPDSRGAKLIGRHTGVVFITENVAATFEQWRERGVRFLFTPRLRRVRYEQQQVSTPVREQQPVWGGVFTRFMDPDGNSFVLLGFDQVNLEIAERRRQLAAKTELERRAAQELEIARQVQARLFPQRLPPSHTLEYAGTCAQARQVGGDYHDFLDLGGGRLALVLADISGKGIAAALLMANLQANLRSQCAGAPDEPERLLTSVNRLFYDATDDRAYATLFFAEYDDGTRRLRYANCGHLAALLFRRDGALERLDSTCTVLGMFREWRCVVEERLLLPGETLVLYTDGITESLDERGEEFGERRLIEALCRLRGEPPAAVVAAILAEAQAFSTREQHDDMTLIVARAYQT